MRGPHGVTTAMRGCYIGGWRLQDEAGRGGERAGRVGVVGSGGELRETETWPNRN